jgi:hypothetical protein
MLHSETILEETDSFRASRTSFSLSLGKARETLSLWRHDTPVAANLALWVLQAMRNGEMKCGRREMSWTVSVQSRILEADMLACR